MVDGRIRVARERGRPEWEVIAGVRFVVALEAPAQPAAVRAFILAAGDRDATLEQLIAATPLAGEAGEGFVLAWWPPGTDPLPDVTVVARGAAVVDLASPGGSRRFEAREVRPWHLAEFGDVERIRISGRGAPLDGDASGELLGDDGRAAGVTTVEWRASQHALEAARAHAWASPEDAADTSLLAHAAPGTTDPTDPVEAIEARTEPVARFRIGQGPPRDIRSRIVLGRRPAAPRLPGDPVELVRVEDDRRVVSASHLELRAEGGRVVATDLRSTNGTIVESTARSHRMRAGESIVVRPGTRLRLGGDTIVEILPPRIDRPSGLDRQAPA
ncbi:FHA domain-containing protein [Agromyces larvae]|uniref:FHA domain-containing protein n=1 Tax=Agromyces larvae TaxID=2929802 RepID=A0ABY4C0C0_9MICO|nr:FHA domain-containing protein [Agromyces larvae]UOE44619.1 FHA domain-containing protein [Agromyces larvae]